MPITNQHLIRLFADIAVEVTALVGEIIELPMLIIIFFVRFQLNLMGLRKIKTANYIPAVAFSVLFVLLEPLVKGLLASVALGA